LCWDLNFHLWLFSLNVSSSNRSSNSSGFHTF
jgi:hypothetical protein